jgi:predicted TIM-barrel fold metal-dependent hydrolase
MDAMKLIDAHLHVGLGGYDPATIIRSMDKQGIEQSWLLTWEERSPPVKQLHIELPPEPLLEAAHKYPGRFVPFYAPDPVRQKLKERFGHYMNLGIKGCGELKVSRKWEDPRLEDYLSLVDQFSMPLVFHMENPGLYYVQEREGYLEWLLERLMNDKFNGVSRYYLGQLAERTGFLRKKIRRNQLHFPGILYDFEGLEVRIRQFPGIRFIGHGPDFWNNIGTLRHAKYIHQRGTIAQFGIIDRMLEQYDNLYCDISGHSGFNALKRDPAQARVFLLKHASKILYGTDNTGLPLLSLLRSMKLGKETMDLILRKNALRVLG